MAKQDYQETSKSLKYLVLFCIGIALGIGMLLWHPFSTGYYNSLAVTYGKDDYPFITTELQNQNYILAVDIGARFPLSLCRETLDEITDKQPQGALTVHNINGQKREVFSYLIPKLKIGDLTLKNIIAYESQTGNYDTLGQFLGKEFNLLIDFPHSRVIACDTFTKLQAKKLINNHWVKIPFEMHRAGIIFRVDTDFGMRRLVINTTSTLSHLRHSFIPSGKPFVSSSLVLEGQPFGNITFESIDLPEGLYEIDGFIGMDFLKKHAIYLDYTHKIAYIEPPRKYFERIPVTLDDRIDPIIDVLIQGSVYPLKLDLGSFISFSLREEILQNIHKTKYGTSKWYDFRGSQYESPTYTIPEIKIGNLTFAHVLAMQDSENFHANTAIGGSPLQLPGVIGLPILEQYNLFLDFPHAAIYASNDLLSLQKADLFSQNFLTIPFILHQDGIILCVETDMATYRLVLDTGTTSTAIRAPHSALTARFCIMGHDFGKRSIKAIELNSEFDFDGLLGMDFLREYPVFIDYSNKRLFIDLQENSTPSKNSLVNVRQK